MQKPNTSVSQGDGGRNGKGSRARGVVEWLCCVVLVDQRVAICNRRLTVVLPWLSKALSEVPRKFLRGATVAQPAAQPFCTVRVPVEYRVHFLVLYQYAYEFGIVPVGTRVQYMQKLYKYPSLCRVLRGELSGSIDQGASSGVQGRELQES